MRLAARLLCGPREHAATENPTSQGALLRCWDALASGARIRHVARWALLLTAAVQLNGCADSRSPTPPTPPPGSNAGCGLGPVTIDTTGPEPCTTVVPACPSPRPSDARSLVWVVSCSFAGRDADCKTIQMPGCPTSVKLVSLRLANLRRGPDRPCASTAEMTIDARATDDGGVRVLWDAQELDAVTCTAAGAEQEGEMSIPGPCCDRVLDVYFPRNDFTARIEVRTDWQR